MAKRREDGSVVLKAYNGDRAQNLEGIADAIEETLHYKGEGEIPTVTLDPKQARTLHGYGEQLRIIADEIRPLYQQKRTRK